MACEVQLDIATQLDDDKGPAQQGVVDTRGIRKETGLGEQVDQDERKLTMKIPVECYSRVVGYLRPVKYWNKGKKQEFEDRKPYKVR